MCLLQVEYFNNKIICDLVEQQHSGVISVLDEACFLVGTVTDRVSEGGRVGGKERWISGEGGKEGLVEREGGREGREDGLVERERKQQGDSKQAYLEHSCLSSSTSSTPWMRSTKVTSTTPADS